MGIPNKLWRMTKANANYELCPTYPAALVVPAKIDDSVLSEAATFRSIRRIPNLVWRSRLNGQTISRCSQPLVGITLGRNGGDELLINNIHNASNLDDGANVYESSFNNLCREQREHALSAGNTGTTSTSHDNTNANSMGMGTDIGGTVGATPIKKGGGGRGGYDNSAASSTADVNNNTTHSPRPTANLQTGQGQQGGPAGQAPQRRGSVVPTLKGKPYIILDCRPLLNARANQAGGKGFEREQNYENISIQWMDMENIHTVRQSYNVLEELCCKHSGWLVGLNSCGWLKHVRRILIAAIKICHCVAIEEMSVLVHCSDGWDRTPQLTSLGMLMLDPFYRTIRGFIVLIEKEWVSFGHKFQDRCGWSADGHKDEKERSPVFIQWLDCVHQCILQRPKDFEFNENMLLFIAKHVYSGWFGNFLFNCEKDSSKARSKMSIISLWTCILSNIKPYRNKDYIVNPGLSIPVATKQRMQLWTAYFTKWNDYLWRAAWMADYSHNDIFLLADGFDGNDDKMHINGGILGTGGNGYDDNDSSLIDDSVVNRPWVEDKLVHCCARCSVKFNFFSRKHHCRCCGNIFCDPCASERRIISAISRWQAQRVCIDCAARLDAIAESTDAGGSTSVEVETAISTTKGEREGLVSYNRTRDNGYMGVDANNASFSSLSLAPPPPMSATKGNRDRARESWDNGVGENRGDSDDWGIDLEALRKGNTTGATNR